MKLQSRTAVYWVFLILFCLFLVAPAIAQESIPALENTFTKIQKLLTSSIVRVILVLALAGLAIGLLLNKDNEAAKKKFIMWIVAVAILNAVTAIVTFFYTPS